MNEEIEGASHHAPVLLGPAVRALNLKADGCYVDGTFGRGGHSGAILGELGSGGRLLAIDRDPDAIADAPDALTTDPRFELINGRFSELLRYADERDLVGQMDGVLLDLGVSSPQLDEADRGFSFRSDGPLDMRMDPTSGRSAATWLEKVDEQTLKQVLKQFGEEPFAGRIAKAIVREREKRPITRTRQLAELIERVAGPAARRYKIHPATRTFQAIRVVCNSEIEGLEATIVDAASMLRRGGRVAVISYHSLEDRAAKRAIRSLAHRCVCPPKLPVCGCGRENLVRNITSRPIRPGESEIDQNPRARSARLRIAERL